MFGEPLEVVSGERVMVDSLDGGLQMGVPIVGLDRVLVLGCPVGEVKRRVGEHLA